MSGSLDKLVYMANQIARNLKDADATAAHIRAFWDPRMRAMIRAHDGTGLSDIAQAAVARLG
jgi:formate dehydrogenase subunit delta